MAFNFRSKLGYLYLLFIAIYCVFVLAPAPSELVMAKYHLSASGLRLIDITIIVLMAGIWLASFYGYAELHAYNKSIRKGKDSKHIDTLTRGVLFLALWLPVNSDISSVLKFVATKHPNLLASTVIIDNYSNLLFPLVGFAFLAIGARGLSEIVGQRPKFGAVNLMTIFLVYVGLVYYHLIATTPARTAIYHMSIWPLLTTLVAPYIFMWFMGILATYELYHYRLKVPGILYGKSWTLLAFGLGWLILVSIAFQYLDTMTPRLTNLSFYWLLALVYSLLAVLSVGFIFIALGAKRLRKIEEV